MDWEKKENSSSDLTTGHIEYTFTTRKSKIFEEITIRRFNYDHKFLVICDFIEKSETGFFLQESIDEDLPTEYYAPGLTKSITMHSKEPSELSTFIKLIVKRDTSVREILGDICKLLDISTTLGLTLESFKALPFVEAKTLVLEAQRNRSYDIIYDLLGHYLQQDLLPMEERNTFINLKEIYQLACAVSLDNPHYACAQDYCVEALMRQEMKAVLKEEKEEAGSLDEEEAQAESRYLQNLEREFSHALQGTQQNLTDRLYNELCGYGLGLPPKKLPNIKGEAATLIFLARVIRAAQPALRKQSEQSSGHRFFLDEEIPQHRQVNSF